MIEVSLVETILTYAKILAMHARIFELITLLIAFCAGDLLILKEGGLFLYDSV
jgi:hypothetical protein